ncbi:MA3 domain-containing protein [Cyclospora cayetanensis]|uniref:MA3 domain-containing protein n=1 Tax=Cyclospora cayetanensis TaxID=88456 RepID=A0A1D3CR74_9EIME|nr:MA3 domain-containing protein [Cyclospora cayetanensis]
MADKVLSRKGDLIRDQLESNSVPMDSKDPMYDSEREDDNCFYQVIEVAACDYRSTINNQSCFSVSRASGSLARPEKTAEEFRIAVDEMLKAFFACADSVDLAACLQALDCRCYHDAFVVYAVRASLDRSTEDQRRMSAEFALLADKGLLTRQQLCRAFEKLVQSTDDIELDVPDVASRLFAFIECASLDNCIGADVLSRLPTAFVSKLDPAVVASNIVVQAAVRQMQEFKAALAEFLEDVFESEGVQEAELFLNAQDKPLCQHEFVVKLVVASYSKAPRDRELASNILDRLYGKTLKPDDLQVGFSRLVGAVDDLALDVPQAHDFLTKSLARGVVDELLPPAFLGDRYRLHFGGVGGMQVLKKAQKWLCEQPGKAASERFRKIWTGTDPTMREARIFKHELKACIRKYLDTLDAAEAAKTIIDMNLAPDQDSEVVRKAYIFSMERSKDPEQAAQAVVGLLEQLQALGELDQECIIQGLAQIRDLLPDIELDVPNAQQKICYMVAASRNKGLLPADYVFAEEAVEDGQ